MNQVPKKLLAEFAQLHAASAMAQCKRSTARWLKDIFLVSTLHHGQVKPKLLKSKAVCRLLPVLTTSKQQRDDLFQDRFGKGRKLLFWQRLQAGPRDVQLMSGICKSCLQNLHTLFLCFSPQVDLSCSLWDSETSAEFFPFTKRFPVGKARQPCWLSGPQRAEPQA